MSFYMLLCVSMVFAWCLLVWMCACACTGPMGQRLVLDVFLWRLFTFICWHRISLWTGSLSVQLSWLADKLERSTCPSSLSQPVLGLQTQAMIPDFLHEFWGSQLKSSCFLDRHYGLSHLSCPRKMIFKMILPTRASANNTHSWPIKQRKTTVHLEIIVSGWLGQSLDESPGTCVFADSFFPLQHSQYSF